MNWVAYLLRALVKICIGCTGCTGCTSDTGICGIALVNHGVNKEPVSVNLRIIHLVLSRTSCKLADVYQHAGNGTAR